MKSESRNESGKHPDGSDKLTREEWLRELECGDLIYLTPHMARELAGYLRATPSETALRVPEGFKLVPIKPCEEMCRQGVLALNRGSEVEGYLNGIGRIPEIWAAMLDVAIDPVIMERMTRLAERKS